MRYFIFLLMMFGGNIFAEEIRPLLQGDDWLKGIAQDLRNEEGLQNALFNLRRIEASSSIAYVCGLMKDKNDNFLPDEHNQYHLYDRIMMWGYKGTWISAVRFDREIDLPQDVHCFYGKEVALQVTRLEATVASQGRKTLCQPVKADEPLRSEILNDLRRNYVGDSNSLTLNGPLPTVKFKVDELCATENYAHFMGEPTDDAESVYHHDGDEFTRLDVILKKSADGAWHLMPEGRLLTQQAKVDAVGYYYYGMLREQDLAQLAQVCFVEGDTVNITGTLQQQGEEWTVTPDTPLACVRDVDISQAGWNQRMQLVLIRQEKELLKDLPGKKVQVSGDIFLALSTAHHTPLLLDNIFRLKELSK